MTIAVRAPVAGATMCSWAYPAAFKPPARPAVLHDPVLALHNVGPPTG